MNSVNISGPVQKKYKLYETDSSIDIPKSTIHYRKRKLDFTISDVQVATGMYSDLIWSFV